MRRTFLAAALGLTAGGCESVLGLGPPTLAVDGGASDGCAPGAEVVTRQFVIDSFDAPTNATEAEASGGDLDGDQRVDNAIGMQLATLSAFLPELDLQSTIDADLARGELLQLLQADLGGCAAPATTTLYEGGDRDVPVDATDNFSGEESFRVIGPPRGRMTSGRDGADVTFGGPGGTAELRLPLFARAAPLDLPLVEARIRYAVTSHGAMAGGIAGAIRSDVVDGLVIPSMAESLQAMAARDCAGTAPACCTKGSDGSTAVAIFDKDADCAIAIAEVRDAEVIRTLFAPDLDLYSRGVLDPGGDGEPDAVSIGIAFTAVNAYFLTPTP